MRNRDFFSSISIKHTHIYKENIAMPQHMFAELAISSGSAFIDTLDFFYDEPLLKWFMGLGNKDLTTLRDTAKNMRNLRVSLKKNEEDAMRNFDGRSETRSLRLRRIIEGFEKEKKLNEFFRTMIKFDIKGLQDLEDTINRVLHHGDSRACGGE